MGQFDADFADLLPKDSGKDFSGDFKDLLPKDTGRDFSADFADLAPAAPAMRASQADVRKAEPPDMEVQDISKPARLTLTRGGKTVHEGATDPKTPPEDESEFRKGIAAGTFGAQQMFAAGRAVPVVTALLNLTKEMELYDGIDKGEKAGPAKGYHDLVKVRAQQYERANQEQRAAMRAEGVAAIGDLAENRDELMASWEKYTEHLKSTQGRTPNFTDMRDAQGFIDWFAFSTGQAVPYMAASVMSGVLGFVLGGPPGAMASVALMGAATGAGDISSGQLEKGQAINPERALGFAIPYGALDTLGPVGRAFRSIGKPVVEKVYGGWLKATGKEAGKSSFEEFVNEAGQDIVKDVALASKGEPVVTEENLLQWFNAGMAGAAAGGVAGGAYAARGALQPTEAERRATVVAQELAGAVEATDLTEGTQQAAVDSLRPENAQMQVVETSTPPAAAAQQTAIEAAGGVQQEVVAQEASTAAQAAPSEAPEAAAVSEPAPAEAPAEEAVGTFTVKDEASTTTTRFEDIPEDLIISQPVLVEDSGETVQVKRNAREAFKEADRRVNRYQALIDCMARG